MQQKWNQNFDDEPMTDIPQKFLNAGCDVYMVMQLRHDEKILDERFASELDAGKLCRLRAALNRRGSDKKSDFSAIFLCSTRIFNCHYEFCVKMKSRTIGRQI